MLGAGISVGTIGTGCAVYIGGHLVLRTYMELTQPHLELPNTVRKYPNHRNARLISLSLEDYPNI